MPNLPVVWTKHLKTEKERREFEDYLRNSTRALTRLLDIIEESESNLIKKDISETDFEDPNWSHKQAFRNGRLSGLSEIKTILTFIKG